MTHQNQLRIKNYELRGINYELRITNYAFFLVPHFSKGVRGFFFFFFSLIINNLQLTIDNYSLRLRVFAVNSSSSHFQLSINCRNFVLVIIYILRILCCIPNITSLNVLHKIASVLNTEANYPLPISTNAKPKHTRKRSAL